jgi:hypothetical protein
MYYHNHKARIMSAAVSVAKDCQLRDKTPLPPLLPAEAYMSGRLVM